MKELSGLLDQNRHKRTLLFIGAGFSFGALNRMGEPVPLGNSLRDALLRRVGYTGPYEKISLERAADHFISKKSRHELFDLLKECFDVDKPADHHRKLASFEWSRIYTTNFDNCYESAFNKSQSRMLTTATSADDPTSILQQGQQIIHLNGYVDRLDAGSAIESVRLSRSSYVNTDHRRTKWGSLFRSDLITSGLCIFAGYSLADLDLEQIIASDDRHREKSFFITSEKPDEIEADYFSRFGQVLPIGVKQFAEIVENVLKQQSSTPIGEEFHILRARPFSLPITRGTAPEVSDVARLVMDGEVNMSLLAREVIDGESAYCVPRQSISDWIVNAASTSNSLCVVKGGLGTGKTIGLFQAAITATKHGQRAFFLEPDTTLALKQIDSICRLQGEKVILVDNYSRCINVLKQISLRQPPRCRVVVAERSAIHDDYLGGELADIFKGWKFHEIDLERLTDLEAREFAKYLASYGLLGEFAGTSDRDLVKLITDDCRQQLSNVLLQVINAPVIRKKLDDAADFFSSGTELSKVGVLALVSKVLGLPTDSRTIIDLWGGHAVALSGLNRGADASILRVRNGVVEVLSSSFSEYILRDKIDPEVLMSVIERALRNAVEFESVNARCREFRSSITRISRIQQLFANEERFGYAIRIFEVGRNLAPLQRSPLFWLQYAICGYLLKKWTLAEQIFATAYGLAKGMEKFDTFQIDNHFARFQIERALDQYRDDPKLAEAELRVALQTILTQTSRTSNKHYPYRVASRLSAFVHEFWERLSDGARKEIVRVADVLSERVTKLDVSFREHADVLRCKRALKEIQQRAERS